MIASGRVWLFLLLGVAASLYAESQTHIFQGSPLWGIALAAAWTGLVAWVIHRAQRFWFTRQMERLARAEELARLSFTPLETDTLLERALERLADWTHMETAGVYLLDGSEGVVLRRARNMDGAPTRTLTATDGKDPVLRTALDSRDARILAATSRGTYPPALQPEKGSVLVVPLWNDSRTLGFFLAAAPYPVTLSQETQGWLQLLATQTAAALHNAELYEKAQRESRTDSLTGLASRRHFDEAFRRELAMARRYERPLSLAMIDVDQMKTINDEWGHPVGDEVLRAVGDLLRDTRCGDIAARYGGDEFLLLMPDTSVEQAELAIDRIRARVAEVNRKRRFPFTLRISIGVRQMGGPDVDLLAAADEAMYREKNVHRHEDIRLLRPHADPPLEPMDYGDEQDQEEEKLRRWESR